MKRKSVIIVAILIMAIGFASISTTLIINGNARVSENTDDFSVIFTAASLDGTDVYANVIDNTKKVITFETNELKTLNQTSILTYEVTNNSSNYDAEVTINCKLKDNSEAKYTSIKNEFEGNTTKVLAKETLNGTLTVTLNKTSIEEVREEYVCVLTFNALERDSLGYKGPTEWTYDYTGGEQTFVAPVEGVYKLETWGAQGGSYNEEYNGGYGGYSSGTAPIKENDKLYVNVGGLGNTVNDFSPVIPGGYNGGGDAYVIKESCSNYASSGGGATHIAFTSGILKNVEKSSLFIVSGGGGGVSERYCSTADYHMTNGGSAGGYLGSSLDKIETVWNYVKPTGGTQTSGGLAGTHNTESGATAGSYGQGGSYTRTGGYTSAIGGGGGFYGGGGGMFIGGGGGSGYIGNSILTNKVMYCYNCEESAEESIKTISTTCVSETPTENCAKSGNGYARITLIK